MKHLPSEDCNFWGQGALAANGSQGQLEGNGVSVMTPLEVFLPGSAPTKTSNKVARTEPKQKNLLWERPFRCNQGETSKHTHCSLVLSK